MFSGGRERVFVNETGKESAILLKLIDYSLLHKKSRFQPWLFLGLLKKAILS